MGTEVFGIGGSEVSEATPRLRWVPRSIMQAGDFKLQQAHLIYVVDNDGRRMGSRIEWRDVPTEMDSQ